MAEKFMSGSVLKSSKEQPHDLQAKGVCKIVLPDNESCGTGFLGQFRLSSHDNKLIRGLFTNNHVLGELDIQDESTFELEFHIDDPHHHSGEQSSGTKIIPVKVNELHQLLRFTCPVLDATFIEFNQDVIDKIRRMTPTDLSVEYLNLVDKAEYNELQESDDLKVIGHPIEGCDGGKAIARGGMVRIKGFNILHKASTNRGSSGSPLLSDGKVVGLHKAGREEYNIAVSITAVVQAIERWMQPKYHQQQPPSKHQMNNMGMKLRLNDKRGTIYSYISAAVASHDREEVWLTYTKHGWHHTLTNPMDIDDTAFVFDLQEWRLLGEELPSKNDNISLSEIVNELQKLKVQD